MIEAVTYRWRGHSKSDRNRYRTKDEIEDWMSRDPIARFRAELIAHGVLDEAEADAVEVEAKDAVEARTVAQVAHEHGLTVYSEALEDKRPMLGNDLAMRRFADVPMAAVRWYELSQRGITLIGLVWMAVHVLLLFAVAWLIKAPAFFLGVGSMANIGGAASAPVAAAASQIVSFSGTI